MVTARFIKSTARARQIMLHVFNFSEIKNPDKNTSLTKNDTNEATRI